MARARRAWEAGGAQLPWAPPALTNPLTVTVDDSYANRRITLAAGQDLILRTPATVSSFQTTDTADALIEITGGRHVVWIGGAVQALIPPVTTLTQPVGADDTVLPVDSTAGFPPRGLLRLDGESIRYSSLIPAAFNVHTRRFGYFNTSPVSSDTTHNAGATVYMGENVRQAATFTGQTGEVFLEGLRLGGFLNDGIRATGGGGTMTVQNCRIGPVSNHDIQYETDGHPDCIQSANGGFGTIRVARTTLLAGPNGNGFLNHATDAGGTAVSNYVLRDVDLVDPEGTARGLILTFDAGSTWNMSNVWLRTTAAFGGQVNDPGINQKVNYARWSERQADLVPPATVGLGYRSPGYLP